MKRYFILIVAGIAALALHSCKDETEEWTKRIPVFRVLPPEEVDLSYLTGRPQSLEFTVFASDKWTAEVTGCDRYSLSTTMGGSGKTSVILDAPENEDGVEREATVSFYFLGELKQQFEIYQLIQEPYIELSVDDGELNIIGFGGSASVDILTNQDEWQLSSAYPVPAWLTLETTGNTLTFSAEENNTGATREATLLVEVVGKEDELYVFLTVSQGEPAEVPDDLILDVVFNTDGTATDASDSKLTVKTDRLNSDCTVKAVSQFGRNAACFNNASIARSKLDFGYYYIPYDETDSFAAKLKDGFSYELVFCTYYNPLDNTKQVKPFASTNAGGIGVCLQANTGRIQFETHVGGGWKSPASSVIPVLNLYYHVVATWDKTAGIATIYVNGKKENSINASGDLKFQGTNVGKRWFGIGADPSADDQGEASFHGEVVVARLYDAPMSEAEAMACYFDLFN